MTFFNYFQLIVMLIVLGVIVSKAIYSWRVTGIFPIVIGRGKGKWRLLEGLAFLALIVWITEILLRAFRARFDISPDRLHLGFFQTDAARIIGVALILIGLIPFILAFVNFGTSWRIGIDRQTPGVLVTGGIFSLTRNPIYVGFILFFFGIFFLNSTWFFLIYALLAVVAIHFQVLREEEFLKKQYGQSYEEYSRRVARYLFW